MTLHAKMAMPDFQRDTLEKVFIPENFSIASYNQEMRACHFHREVANENKQFKGTIKNLHI